MRKTLLLGATAIGLTVAGAIPAAAQTAPPTAPTVGLEEVIVTAQRREENLQRAAVALSVVGGEELQRQGVLQPSQLQQSVPALQAQTAGNFTNFYIRGVGAPVANGYADPGVAFNYDGVYISRPTSTSGFLYDIQRVEVLKGPQGTLYGRNATGGAVNVLPQLPMLGKMGGNLTGEVGNYDLAHVNGALNVPVGDNSAVRLAFNWVDHSGYLRDGTDDEKSRAARLQFLTKPSDDLTIRVAADYYHRGGKAGGSTAISTADPIISGGVVTGFTYNPTNVPPGAGNLSPEAGAVFRSRFVPVAKVFAQPLTPSNYADNDFKGINAQVDWRTPVGTLTLLPAYRYSHLNTITQQPGFYTFLYETDKQKSFEVRLASSEDHPLRYLLGAYYLDEKIRARYVFNVTFIESQQDVDTGVKSYATFGRLTWEIMPGVRLNGGIRYTKDKRHFDGPEILATDVCVAPPLPSQAPCVNGATLPNVFNLSELGVTAPYSGVIPFPGHTAIISKGFLPGGSPLSQDAVTWRAAAEWDVGPASLLYASYETGFRSGGYFYATGRNTFQPEHIRAFTVGSKNRFLDNRLQINAEAFLWKYRNQQVSHFSSDPTGLLVFVTENVGRSTNKGVEVETRFLATENTLLRADVQYLRARFDQFAYNAPNQGTPPANGCPFTLTGPTYLIDCSGRAPPRAPKWTMNFGVQQTLPLGEAGSLIGSVDTHYQSKTFVGTDYLASELLKSYWQSSASLTYKPRDGRWLVTAFVNNIENKRLAANVGANTIGIYSASFQPPRTYGVRATVEF